MTHDQGAVSLPADLRKLKWLREEAGACLDDLKSALEDFQTYDLQSLVRLQRQIGAVAAAAHAAELPALAETAGRAGRAGVLDVRAQASGLVTLLRGAMRGAQEPRRERYETDAETGLAMCACLRGRTRHIEQPDGLPGGMVSVSIDGLDAVRRERGADGATLLIGHVGRVLQRQLRDGDCFARLGPCGLVIYLPGQDRKGVETAATRMRDAVARAPIQWPDGTSQAITISTGGCHPCATRAAGESGGRPEVVIVADHTTMEKTLTHLVQQAGGRVAASGSADGDMWKTLDHHPVCYVLVDVAFHSLGPLLRRLVDLYACQRAPIVVTVQDQKQAEWALNHGARTVLLKPLHPAEVIKTLRQLSSRGRKGTGRNQRAASSCTLVVSSDLAQLIMIGTSLQKDAHLPVRLCRDTKGAIERAQQCQPAAAVIDVHMDYTNAEILLSSLALLSPPPRVVLITDEIEKTSARLLKGPGVVDIVEKPVQLIGLASRVAETTGLSTHITGPESAEILREEILRVM